MLKVAITITVSLQEAYQVINPLAFHLPSRKRYANRPYPYIVLYDQTYSFEVSVSILHLARPSVDQSVLDFLYGTTCHHLLGVAPDAVHFVLSSASRHNLVDRC